MPSLGRALLCLLCSFLVLIKCIFGSYIYCAMVLNGRAKIIDNILLPRTLHPPGGVNVQKNSSVFHS